MEFVLVLISVMQKVASPVSVMLLAAAVPSNHCALKSIVKEIIKE